MYVQYSSLYGLLSLKIELVSELKNTCAPIVTRLKSSQNQELKTKTIMRKCYFTLIIALLALFSSITVNAEEKSQTKLGYFTLEPELTTNFYTKGKDLGYITLRVEIMVADGNDLPLIEHNQPLIRDAIVELLGRQTGDTIKSLAGREDLRKTLVKQVNDLLLPETGRPIVADLLFTKYMYQ